MNRKMVLLLSLLLIPGAAAVADPGDLTLDVGIAYRRGVPDCAARYIDNAWKYSKYPLIEGEQNPFGVLDLSIELPRHIYIGWLHASSMPDDDFNYGFNLLYVKKRFRWHL